MLSRGRTLLDHRELLKLMSPVRDLSAMPGQSGTVGGKSEVALEGRGRISFARTSSTRASFCSDDSPRSGLRVDRGLEESPTPYCGIAERKDHRCEGIVTRSRKGGVMKRDLRNVLRFAGFTAVILLPGTGTSFGQVEPFLLVTKTCPTEVNQGESFQCTFTVKNLFSSGAEGLVYTNQFPFPGGPVVPLECRQPDSMGTPVTVLGPLGSQADTCFGVIPETAPISCNPESEVLLDQVVVTGQFNTDPPLPLSSSAVNGVTVSGSNCVGLPGRMTGGGSTFTAEGERVTHGFALHCDIENGSNELEVNWRGNRFRMEELVFAVCLDTAIDQKAPSHAPFDTYIGTATGRCNGAPGATVDFTFVDAGEPGTHDSMTIEITGCPETGGVSVSGNLDTGNHRAHAD